MTTKEKVTADVHGIIDYAVDGLSIVPTGFIAYEDNIIRERLNYFNLSTYDLSKDGKAVRNVAKNRVFIVANNDSGLCTDGGAKCYDRRESKSFGHGTKKKG